MSVDIVVQSTLQILFTYTTFESPTKRKSARIPSCFSPTRAARSSDFHSASPARRLPEYFPSTPRSAIRRVPLGSVSQVSRLKSMSLMTDEEVSQVPLHPALASMVTDDWSPFTFPVNVSRKRTVDEFSIW